MWCICSEKCFSIEWWRVPSRVETFAFNNVFNFCTKVNNLKLLFYSSESTADPKGKMYVSASTERTEKGIWRYTLLLKTYWYKFANVACFYEILHKWHRQPRWINLYRKPIVYFTFAISRIWILFQKMRFL